MSKKFKNFCLYAFYAVVILAALFSLFAPTIEGFPEVEAGPKVVEFDGYEPVVEEETIFTPIFTSIREFFNILYLLLKKLFT